MNLIKNMSETAFTLFPLRKVVMIHRGEVVTGESFVAPRSTLDRQPVGALIASGPLKEADLENLEMRVHPCGRLIIYSEALADELLSQFVKLRPDARVLSVWDDPKAGSYLVAAKTN